jgi:hypothetical protein
MRSAEDVLLVQASRKADAALVSGKGVGVRLLHPFRLNDLGQAHASGIAIDPVTLHSPPHRFKSMISSWIVDAAFIPSLWGRDTFAACFDGFLMRRLQCSLSLA